MENRIAGVNTDVNVADSKGRTPLLEAAVNRSSAIAELLRKNGAKMLLKEGSLLCQATSDCDAPLIRSFCENDANVDCGDYDG
eukprot:7947698-Pyramimonas_sp.AAC.1